jgi:hypothetical protein
LANIPVNLYVDDGDGVFEPGNGDLLVRATASDQTGGYFFANLTPGTYWVETAHPSNYSPTTPNPAGPVVLNAGEFKEVNFGLIEYF